MMVEIMVDIDFGYLRSSHLISCAVK